MEDKQVEEIKRHFDLVAGGLKDEIKLVAEGHILLNEKIGRAADNLNEKIDTAESNLQSEIKVVAGGQDKISQDVRIFRKEVDGEFGEIKSAIKFSYNRPDQRITSLENKYEEMDQRLRHPEASR